MLKLTVVIVSAQILLTTSSLFGEIPMTKKNEMVKIKDQIYSGNMVIKLSSFSISKYAIMQGEWQTVMGNNPSKFVGDLNRPVECVSWYDAVNYCNKRSVK